MRAMMRLAAVAVMAAGLGAGAASDFRSVRWGMTILDVITAEGREPVQREDDGRYIVEYEGLQVAGMPASLGYGFDDEHRLKHAVYVLTAAPRSGQEWFDGMDRLELLLTQKYGPAADKDVRWRRLQYARNPADYPFAVSIGDLEIVTHWLTPRTTIVLRLDGSNYETGLSVYYSRTGNDFDPMEALGDL